MNLPAVFLLSFACSAAPCQQTPLPQRASASQAESPTAGGEIVDKIVATVNGRAITASEVRDEVWMQRLSGYLSNPGSPLPPTTIGPAEFQTALEHQIDQELVEQAVDRNLQQFSPDPLADRQIEAMQQRAGGAEKFQQLLSTFHLTRSGIRDLIERQLTVVSILDARVESSIHVTDRDVHRYYKGIFVPRALALHEQPAPETTVSSQIRQLLAETQRGELEKHLLETLRAAANIQTRNKN